MHYNKPLLIANLLFAAHYSFGQLSIPFSFGVIANNKAASFSGPIVMSSKTNCLAVKNGVVLYQDPSNHRGVFISNCDNNSIDKVHFSISPNPINGVGKIYAEGIKSISQAFTISVFDSKGMKVKSITNTGISFINGVELFMGDAAAGIYFANIYSNNFKQTIKFINTGY